MGIKSLKNKNIDLKRQAQLLTVYVCIIVIARCVYFPFHHIDGHIGTLNIDINRIFPVKYNIIPIVRLFEKYDGWKTNIIGNIAMFIPVGIVFPFCFKELNSLLKTTGAGLLFTLCIEISQLLSYERCSDIDDIILNTTGVFLGALIYFAIKKVVIAFSSEQGFIHPEE
ncbi:MAG: VanZ family protein [Treponema sp.]|nr:VanZ family protein [Treponema sp.]